MAVDLTAAEKIVPLWVLLSSPELDEDFEFVIDNSPVPVTTGRFKCRAFAPSGLHVQRIVTLGETLPYDEIKALFPHDGVGDLLLGPPRAGEIRESSWEPKICAWHGRNLVAKERWRWGPSVNDSELQGIGIEGPGEVDTIQYWSANGPSIVTRLPTEAMIFPVGAPVGSERSLRTAIVGGDLECAAYWAFNRNSLPTPALELGTRIAQELNEKSDIERAIVAAHLIITFDIVDDDLIAAVARRLAMAPDVSDAAVMLWALRFEGRAGSYDQDGARLFAWAVKALHRSACRYTATLRIFIERYAMALPEGGMAALDPELTEPINWIQKLAMATFWDGDYLSYRAKEPGDPDSKATDAVVDGLAKKKCVTLP